MRIDENNSYIPQTEQLYLLGLSSLGVVIILTQWRFPDPTHTLALIAVLSLIFLWLMLDYLIARTVLRLTFLRYARVSTDYFGTGVFFAMVNFNYIVVLIIGTGCVISLLLYKDKYLLLNIVLICLGAGITYLLLSLLASDWKPFVADPITITVALLLISTYSIIILSLGLKQHKRMVQQLSLVATDNKALTIVYFNSQNIFPPLLDARYFLGCSSNKNQKKNRLPFSFLTSLVLLVFPNSFPLMN